MRKVAKLTKLCLDIERLVFFPAVDVPEDVRVTVWARGIGEELEDINFFAEA